VGIVVAALGLDIVVGHVGGLTKPQVTGSRVGCRQITQIYEGTNQVQRIVMARQLLAGVQSEL
jgi:hypothetical protein